MKFNNREKRLLSITIAACGVFLIGSGLIMNANTHTITNTKYSLKVEKKKISETQAKSNEIKLKEIETEVNIPISVDVKDYLENINDLDEATLKALKLDTSLVNITQPGSYQYSITYNKKKYVSTIKVNEKEIPTITLKDLTFEIDNIVFSQYAKDYINETLEPEVYNTCNIDEESFKEVKEAKTAGDNYKYSIKCGDITYVGKVTIKNKEIQPVEIILKQNIEININGNISNNVIDYIENINSLNGNVIKDLKLDKSKVNVKSAGTYTYTVTYNNKTYNGTIIVKDNTNNEPEQDIVIKPLQ